MNNNSKNIFMQIAIIFIINIYYIIFILYETIT